MSPTATTAGSVASRPAVEAGGTALTPAVAACLRTTVVDTDANGPDSCRLVFDDPGRTLLSDSGIDLAATLTVGAGRVGDDTAEPLFDGVVYAVGFEHDDRGAFTVVTAYDRSYSLFHGRHTVSYQNMTDGDLATKIAHDLGLTPQVDSTSVVHEQVSQFNETYFDFLTRRAREVDFMFRVVGTTFSFVRSTTASDGPAPGDFGAADRLQLVPGGNLQRLSVRVSGAQQVKEVQVRGWDVQNKEALVGTADATTRTATMTDTPAGVAGVFDGGTFVVTDLPLSTQAECDAAAASAAERIGGTSLHAEGTAFGDPRIVAGAPVSLGGTGGRFDGQVTVTRAKHVWDGTGYRTTFVASGSNARSVMGLVNGADRKDRRPEVPGVVVGIVTSLEDPDGLGRVRLRFPWLDADYESGWARVVQQGAGKGFGLAILPEVDDEVLVAFEHGDPRSPFVVGGVHNGRDEFQSEVLKSGSVEKRLWRSRSGHLIALDDTSGSEKVSITTTGGITVLLDDASKKVTITSTGDVEVTSEGSIAVTAKADLSLEATGSATVKAGGSLTLEASADVTVKGAVIKLN